MPKRKKATVGSGTIGGIQLLQVWETLARLGAGPAAMRRIVGRRPDELEQATARLPLSMAFRLFDEAERATGDVNVGLHAGARVSFRGPIVFLLMSCARLRQALEMCVRFRRLFADDLVASVDVDGGAASLIVTLANGTPPESRHFLDYLLVGVARTLREAAASPPALLEVHVPFRRRAEDASETVYGCRVRFQRPDYRLVFAARDVDTPFRQANPAVQRELEKFTAALIEQTVPTTFRARVEGAIRATVATGARADRAAIARRLHSSDRTLHRRLLDEGTTFKDARDGVLRAIVEAQLGNPDLPIKVVSASVGFADVAAFSRAFRRWTGRAPAAFRSAFVRRKVLTPRRGRR